jgi:hypothetical protein
MRSKAPPGQDGMCRHTTRTTCEGAGIAESLQFMCRHHPWTRCEVSVARDPDRRRAIKLLGDQQSMIRRQDGRLRHYPKRREVGARQVAGKPVIVPYGTAKRRAVPRELAPGKTRASAADGPRYSARQLALAAGR